VKRFFTSDLHFSHRNVINYCKRPYKDVTEMNNAIVQEWNRVVGPDDIVYILGDVSLNPKVVEEWVPKLNGVLYLIHGNHDATYPIAHGKPNRKASKMKERYHTAGFKAVLDQTTVELKNGRKVLLSHLPYSSTKNYDDRFMDMRPKDNGLFLLHGHLHAKYLKNKNMIDVGWDQKHSLFSEEEIINLIDNKKQFIYSTLYPRKTFFQWIKSLLEPKRKKYGKEV